MMMGESTKDYILRAEKAATSLKSSDEVISDRLLVAMALKSLPESYKTFTTVAKIETDNIFRFQIGTRQF